MDISRHICTFVFFYIYKCHKRFPGCGARKKAVILFSIAGGFARLYSEPMTRGASQIYRNMKIEDLAVKRDITLTVEYSVRYKRWKAFFKGFGFNDGQPFKLVFGSGETPEEALENFIPKIAGKQMVAGVVGLPTRKDVDVPTEIKR